MTGTATSPRAARTHEKPAPTGERVGVGSDSLGRIFTFRDSRSRGATPKATFLSSERPASNDLFLQVRSGPLPALLSRPQLVFLFWVYDRLSFGEEVMVFFPGADAIAWHIAGLIPDQRCSTFGTGSKHEFVPSWIRLLSGKRRLVRQAICRLESSHGGSLELGRSEHRNYSSRRSLEVIVQRVSNLSVGSLESLAGWNCHALILADRAAQKPGGFMFWENPTFLLVYQFHRVCFFYGSGESISHFPLFFFGDIAVLADTRAVNRIPSASGHAAGAALARAEWSGCFRGGAANDFVGGRRLFGGDHPAFAIRIPACADAFQLVFYGIGVAGDGNQAVDIGSGGHFSVFLLTFRASPGGNQRGFPADEMNLPFSFIVSTKIFNSAKIFSATISDGHRPTLQD